MISKYSKPSAGIWKSTTDILARDDELLRQQSEIAKVLHAGNERHDCPNCGGSDFEPAFTHRSIDYRCCKQCGHLTTRVSPPANYPYSESQDFGQIYSQQNLEQYLSRVSGIYQPKLSWLIEVLKEIDHRGDPLSLSWGELGSGAGYFVKAAQMAGIQSVQGYELDPKLIEQSLVALEPSMLVQSKSSIDALLRDSQYDIYVSWFVLEHVESLGAVWDALRLKPSGTYFAFSVPTFGFSTLLESSVQSHYARNLDSVFHTQMFTSESIEYGLQRAEMELVSEWVFGQDSVDLLRCILKEIEHSYSSDFLSSVKGKLEPLVDSLQGVFDKGHFADARHILAKRI